MAQEEANYVGIAYDPVTTEVVGPATAILTRTQGEMRGEITVLGESIPVDAGAWDQARSPDGPVDKFQVEHKGHVVHLAGGTDGVGGRISEHYFVESDPLTPQLSGTGFTVAVASEYSADDIASGIQR